MYPTSTIGISPRRAKSSGAYFCDAEERLALGLCARCGYDLRGSAGDRCSECGWAAPQRNEALHWPAPESERALDVAQERTDAGVFAGGDAGIIVGEAAGGRLFGRHCLRWVGAGWRAVGIAGLVGPRAGRFSAVAATERL